MGVEFRQGWGWLVLAALTVSTIGDEITLLALMFRTAEKAPAYAVPVLLIMELLPGLIAAPYAGRLIDRRDAARILVMASALQAGIISLIAHYPTFTLAGAALLSVLFTISSAATFALIPVLASGLGMTLARANSLLEMVRSLGMLAGPVAGGVLVGWIGSRNTLLVDAFSFALLALVVMGSGLRRKPQRGDHEEQTLFADYLPLLRNRRLMVVTGALSLEVFATAIADVAFVFLVMVTLGSGPTAFGMLTALWAGGMLIGAGLAEKVIGHRIGLTAFGTATVMGVTMLLIGLAPIGFAIVAVAFILGGGANSIHNVAVRTLLQSECPPADHGKVAAIYGAVTRTAVIGGYVAGGFFVPNDAPTAYLVGGLLGVAAGVIGWRIFNGGWRTAPI
ncbi:MFS transporter [Sphingobium yanoikuyae]|uniref:MFS transporter n=1 Tax=Sphingobium yanoikuyae TaxID=13690 RepID=A0AA42WTL0_SPHYA|nr:MULTISPECIES: MFS transporter [Sphingobium]MBV2150303.1 MFS transporter [Sphingobium sp. AS12]MDH2129619.1 MFS transporter [Sphingobium yanoikuyae]MDH2149713.1 MFS transporter [Sphingobium yanoikuyae]MDH2165462.1 MFS transporter [Sphingobium yanoikuyae]QWT14239.1 MFS transporter [Sphingobium xenophagum]